MSLLYTRNSHIPSFFHKIFIAESCDEIMNRINNDHKNIHNNTLPIISLLSEGQYYEGIWICLLIILLIVAVTFT